MLCGASSTLVLNTSLHVTKNMFYRSSNCHYPSHSETNFWAFHSEDILVLHCIGLGQYHDVAPTGCVYIICFIIYEIQGMNNTFSFNTHSSSLIQDFQIQKIPPSVHNAYYRGRLWFYAFLPSVQKPTAAGSAAGRSLLPTACGWRQTAGQPQVDRNTEGSFTPDYA